MIQLIDVAPGEMGFGEELRRILVGVGAQLKAGPDATVKVVEGIKERLSQENAVVGILPNGLRVKVRGKIDVVPAIAREVASVISVQK